MLLYIHGRELKIMLINGFFNLPNILGSAMQGTAARGQAINNNIANVDTPDFSRQIVLFEEQLQKAVNSFQNSGRLDLSSFRPQITTEARNLQHRLDGNNIDIEFEMAMLYQNSVRFDVLATGIMNHYRMINLVIGMA